MMPVTLPITGVIVPMLTAFKDSGEVDTEASAQLVDFLIDKGVAGLFPLGTTGEGPLLNQEERFLVAAETVRLAAGRVPVIIHSGAITTRDAITFTRHAQDVGAQAAAVIPPYFYRISEDALFDHFAAIAQAAPDFPVYLYENPGVTSNLISLNLALRLADACPNILGLKDSSGSLDTLAATAGLKGGQFNTASGSDAVVLAGQAMGLDACISGNANYVPELVVGIVNAVRSGDLDRARILQHQLNHVRRALGDGRDLSLFKAMCARRGIPVGDVRAPLKRASRAAIEAAWAELVQLEVFETA